jgi:hypothetical protein
MKSTTRCFLASGLALGMVATSQAALNFVYRTNQGVDGDWSNPAIWGDGPVGTVPDDAGDFPIIQDGRTATLSSGSYVVYDLIVGLNSGTSTLNVSGGSLTTSQGDEFIVGGNANGVINQTGGDITVPVGNVQFGASWGNGAGTWNLSSGTMTVANWMVHNIHATGVTPTVSLTGGTMSFTGWANGMPNLINDGTTISPGLAGTAMTSNIEMNFIQNSGTLQFDIGDGGSDFIQMFNSGYGGTVVADLSGTLELNALGAITPGVWFNVLETQGGAITDNLTLADPASWNKQVVGNALQVQYIPEPSSALLVGFAGLICTAFRRRQG